MLVCNKIHANVTHNKVLKVAVTAVLNACISRLT